METENIKKMSPLDSCPVWAFRPARIISQSSIAGSLPITKASSMSCGNAVPGNHREGFKKQASDNKKAAREKEDGGNIPDVKVQHMVWDKRSTA